MTTQCFFWCNLVLGWFVCFGDFLSTEATDQTLADWRAPGGCVRQLTTDLVCTLILIENLDDRIKLKFQKNEILIVYDTKIKSYLSNTDDTWR